MNKATFFSGLLMAVVGLSAGAQDAKSIKFQAASAKTQILIFDESAATECSTISAADGQAVFDLIPNSSYKPDFDIKNHAKAFAIAKRVNTSVCVTTIPVEISVFEPFSYKSTGLYIHKARYFGKKEQDLPEMARTGAIEGLRTLLRRTAGGCAGDAREFTQTGSEIKIAETEPLKALANCTAESALNYFSDAKATADAGVQLYSSTVLAKTAEFVALANTLKGQAQAATAATLRYLADQLDVNNGHGPEKSTENK